MTRLYPPPQACSASRSAYETLWSWLVVGTTMDRQHESTAAAMREAGISIENAMFAQHLKAPAQAEPQSRRSSFAVSEAEQGTDENVICEADDDALRARYARRGREQQGASSYLRLTLAENFSGTYASGTVMGVSEQLRRKSKES